jgi:hypothetical protein
MILGKVLSVSIVTKLDKYIRRGPLWQFWRFFSQSPHPAGGREKVVGAILLREGANASHMGGGGIE